MDTYVLIIVIVAVALLTIGAIAVPKRNEKSGHLQERLGPEYDRAVGETGTRSEPEKHLPSREQRSDGFKMRDLSIENELGQTVMPARARLLILPAVFVLALGVLGCSDTDEPDASTPAPVTQTPAPATAEPTTAEPTTADPASPQASAGDADEHNAAALRAIATAQQAEDGTAYEIDDEDDDNTWEVDVMVGDRSVEVDVSADGNTVVSRDDDDDADDDDRARLDRAQINLTQAIEAALREVPGRLDDAELDDEDDRDVWEVTIDAPDDDDVDVYVSPQDGSIIKVDR